MPELLAIGAARRTGLAICRLTVTRFRDHLDVGLFARAKRINNCVVVGSTLKCNCVALRRVSFFGARRPFRVDTAVSRACWTGIRLAIEYGKAWRRNPRLLLLWAPYANNVFVLTHYEAKLL